ncbi:MAG: hypothetical protein M9894_18635 [Planctomycetes bacterium]|nr:hypothetical protein [Planctomycetota bacterium]
MLSRMVAGAREGASMAALRGEQRGEVAAPVPVEGASGSGGSAVELLAMADEMRRRAAELEARAGVVPSAAVLALPRKRRKARRTKTSHPGVKLRARTWANGEVTWFARWVDPDNPTTPDGKRREVDTNLTKLGLSTEAARVDWCRRKSAALLERQAALAAGAPRYTNTPLRAALDAYLAHVKDTKSQKTHGAYRLAVERFVAWAGQRGLATTDALTTHELAAFREHMIAGRKHVVLAGQGAGRGAHAPSDTRLSEASINSYLGAMVIALNHLRRVGKLPRVRTGEDVQDALKPIKEPKRLPEILRPDQVQELLLACEAHDAECWLLTREEHDGLRPKGTTPRYPSVMPFVVFLLLSGCRVSEGLSLDWRDVDLEASDDQGKPVGLVRIVAHKSKTREERVVDFAPTPALGPLLRALRARTGGEGRVFGHLNETLAKAALRRLTAPKMKRKQKGVVPGYGAPKFGWHTLRRTCGTYLTCAPSIYGAAAVFLVARRLGHSVQVSEKHYLNTVRGIDPKHRTLEDALGVRGLLDALLGRLNPVSYSGGAG